MVGGPERFTAGEKIKSALKMGGLTTYALLFEGSPALQSREENQKWPTNGQIGYITSTVLGIPNALEWGKESILAHKWADWLHNPCCLGGPLCFTVGEKISNGPQVGTLAT